MSGNVGPNPKVQGRCPACGSNSLFLGESGYVTCTVDDWDEVVRLVRESQAAIDAWWKSENRKRGRAMPSCDCVSLRAKIDSLDCRFREGGDTRHCSVHDGKQGCLWCRHEALQAERDTLKKLLAEKSEERDNAVANCASVEHDFDELAEVRNQLAVKLQAAERECGSLKSKLAAVREAAK